MSSNNNNVCECCSKDFQCLTLLYKDLMYYYYADEKDHFIDNISQYRQMYDDTEEGFIDYCYSEENSPFIKFLRINAFLEHVSLDDKIIEFYNTHFKKQ